METDPAFRMNRDSFELEVTWKHYKALHSTSAGVISKGFTVIGEIEISLGSSGTHREGRTTVSKTYGHTGIMLRV